jgi:GPH family glycoside/pentoside/hexuronide:cation symporter
MACGRALLLVLTYAAYSALSVAHQSWGAMLGGDEASAAASWPGAKAWRWWAWCWRRCCPLLLGLRLTGGCLRLPGARLAGLGRAPVRARPPCRRDRPRRPLAALRAPAFRRLLACSCSTALPAPFRPRWCCSSCRTGCRHPRAGAGLPGQLFRLCAALSIPLWLRAGGAASAWRVLAGGMLLAVAVFVWAGDSWARATPRLLLVCALSGVALGTDLALPGAMLAGVIANAGDRGSAEGAYFGWWNFATKLNLALAAGLALPLLGCVSATRPARASEDALQALTWPTACCPACSSCWPPAAVPAGHRGHPPRPWCMTGRLSMKRRASCSPPPRPQPPACGPGRLRQPEHPGLRQEKPVLDLRSYFNGTLDAHGIFTDRSGKVVRASPW